MRELHSDVRTDLINLTQSALPWLCQGEPIPDLDHTIDERRPTNTITSTHPLLPTSHDDKKTREEPDQAGARAASTSVARLGSRHSPGLPGDILQLETAAVVWP